MHPGGIRSWSVAGVLAWLAALLVFAFALTVLGVALLAFRDPAARLPDAVPLVIVLGGGMAADGTLGRTTVPRFEAGLAILAEGRAGAIHLSGGDRLAGITEGALMAAIAGKRFPEAVVTYEDRSQSTLQNALFSRPVLGPLADGPVMLVTDGFHLARAWASFRWDGYGPVRLAAATAFGDQPIARQIYWTAREAAAWWLNLARASMFEAIVLLRGPEAAPVEMLR
jgi:uncharacterized SAM-binding protein YcdF (DUF218 family)